jgi:FMN phosphatase YigB (HAD superfamily)
VHIFTGSTRERVFNALKVLIGNSSDQFIYDRVLAVDDMSQGTKPDPEAYQEMLERFNIEPESTIFVDDQLSEVETAASLGMITFLIQKQNLGETELPPHIVLNSLFDLLDHLEID